MCPVDSRLEGEAIKRERHMGIVRERRSVIGTLRDSNLKWIGHSHHVPSPFRRIAMGIASPNLRSRSLPPRHLRLAEVSCQSHLLHGLARVRFCVGFFLAQECIFIQPRQRVIEIDHVIRFLRVFFGQQGIDLFAQSLSHPDSPPAAARFLQSPAVAQCRDPPKAPSTH